MKHMSTELRAGSMQKQSSFFTLTLNCIVAGFGVGILVALLLACIITMLAII
ncbi:MAG: hypothetical protein WD750_02775 [Gammaproteobacteria bacterium]